MAKFDMAAVWRDIVIYRNAYVLTAIASFGGMLFGTSCSESVDVFISTNRNRVGYGADWCKASYLLLRYEAAKELTSFSRVS